MESAKLCLVQISSYCNTKGLLFLKCTLLQRKKGAVALLSHSPHSWERFALAAFAPFPIKLIATNSRARCFAFCNCRHLFNHFHALRTNLKCHFSLRPRHTLRCFCLHASVLLFSLSTADAYGGSIDPLFSGQWEHKRESEGGILSI